MIRAPEQDMPSASRSSRKTGPGRMEQSIFKRGAIKALSA
jgi:hypothetical protein